MPQSDPPPKKRPEPDETARFASPSPLPETDVEFETDIILTDAELKLGEPEIAAAQAQAEDVEISTGEADIALDDLGLDEGDDPFPSPFERITVAPEVPEGEYVARMMREAPPSDPVPASRAQTPSPPTRDRAAAERISGMVSAQATPEPADRSVSSWPSFDFEEPLTLDLADSVPPPAASSDEPLSLDPDAPDTAAPSIPPPPSLPGETPTGVRERTLEPPVRRDSPLSSDAPEPKPPNGAPFSFGPTSGDALELVGVRSQSIKPAASPRISMRAVRDRFDVGDFSGALILAEGILEHDPESVDALLYAEHCRDVLKQMYISRLGGVGKVPQVAISDEQLRWLNLDHRAGFLLSLVDGNSSFEELLDMSGMPAVDALRLLLELLQQNVIKVA